MGRTTATLQLTLATLVALVSPGAWAAVFPAPVHHPPGASVVLVPKGSSAQLSTLQSAVPLVYVGGPQAGGGVSALLLRQEAAEGGGSGQPEQPPDGGSYIDTILSWIPHIPIINPAPEKPAEGVEGTKPESSDTAAAAAPSPARLEDLDEGVGMGMDLRPGRLPPGGGQQQFVLLGQPQFFGNYDVLRRLGIQNIGTRGGVLVAGAVPPPRHLGGRPTPEKVLSEPESANSAANDSGFQRYSQQGAMFSQHLRDMAAASSTEAPSSEEDKEDEEVVGDAGPAAGPSVAQVKPQALALAGPGGVAAAAPMGTALVGPGGLAVASPSATAIAGPAGGAPPIAIAPAAYKNYLQQLQQQASKGNTRKGSAFVAYNA